MMRKLAIVAVACLAAFNFAYGWGFQWAVGTGYCYYSNGVTMLDGGSTGSSGCFAQLLWSGPNGLIDSAEPTGDGTGAGDDVVLQTMYMGAGGAGGDNGWFSGGEVFEGGNVVSGRTYFARLWSDYSPDYATGLVPTSLTNKYGNSSLYTWERKIETGDAFDINFGGNISTTLTAVPEPAAIVLGLIGLITIRVMARRRS